MSSRQERQERRLKKRIRRSTNKLTLTTAHPLSLYEALDPNLKEIRVLEVAPGIGDEIVVCTMRRISLLDDPVPAYETISYCWGPPRDPATIKLNGHMTSVPASSEAAIRCMRLSSGPRTFWIDAICIDQSSVTERSAQVAFMSTVYSAGMRNLVYLGEDDGMARRGVKALEDVVADMRAATANLTQLSQTIFAKGTKAIVFSNEGFIEEIDFEALEVLFSLNWFRRLWVLQEVVLATTNTCRWGTFEFDLLETIRAAQWLVHKNRFIPRSLSGSVGLSCAFQMFDLLDRDHGRSTNYRTLSKMLIVARFFNKTEARDSIYAILGLLDQDRALGGNEAALLEVDYQKPLPDVLRDATRYALYEGNNLLSLRLINHQVDIVEDSQTFPTWTIRMDLPRWLQDVQFLPTHYRAFKGLEASSLLSDVTFDKNVLLLQGIVVDQVVQTTITCGESIWNIYEGYRQWLVSVKDMATHHCNNAMEENIDLAIACTLVAGFTESGEEAQPDDLQKLVEYIKSLTMCEDGVNLDGLSIRSHVDMAKLKALRSTLELYICIGRRFFVTAAGRMGLGPRCMQPEDIVVVLRGGPTPFILRKQANGYWLIGEAYVHGVMHDEAVQIEKSRGGSEVVFPVL